MTKEQLAAENKALRDLLAAARAYADIPRAARVGDIAYEFECEKRLDGLAVYADGDRGDMSREVYLLVLGDRAKELRERAARPVRYEAKADETASAAA